MASTLAQFFRDLDSKGEDILAGMTIGEWVFAMDHSEYVKDLAFVDWVSGVVDLWLARFKRLWDRCATVDDKVCLCLEAETLFGFISGAVFAVTKLAQGIAQCVQNFSGAGAGTGNMLPVHVMGAMHEWACARLLVSGDVCSMKVEKGVEEAFAQGKCGADRPIPLCMDYGSEVVWRYTDKEVRKADCLRGAVLASAKLGFYKGKAWAALMHVFVWKDEAWCAAPARIGRELKAQVDDVCAVFRTALEPGGGTDVAAIAVTEEEFLHAFEPNSLFPSMTVLSERQVQRASRRGK